MSDEPGHKAMLYFLEVLMNSNGPLTISQMAGRFGSRSFSAEMRAAAGGNEVGLKKFLLKYPSLFTVKGNMVSLYDSTAAEENGREGSPASQGSGRSLPDVSQEMEAVQFFQNKLSKKEERWVQVKSLAGHLSQSSAEVRNVVGPQLEFRKWVLRHPHIFEVQGELVGLRDGIAAVSTPALLRRNASAGDLNGAVFAPPLLPAATPVALPPPPPPKTPPATRKFPPKTPPTIRRSKSFNEKYASQSTTPPLAQVQAGQVAAAPPNTPGVRRRGAPVTMTANEYKAVMFLKDIVEKKGGIRLHNITGHFSQATEGVRNTIGWTKMELEEFLKKNANVFAVSEDELVTVIKNAKLNVIITGSRPQGQGVRTLSGRKGKVFHVAKLWGIIDLGKHEHVFFDKSIMKKPIDDLQKDYKMGETLFFNAVLAPKSSRAKWKAIHVWREHEQVQLLSDNDSEISSSDDRRFPLSPSMSIEDEINRFLPPQSIDAEPVDKFSDAAPSGAGVVPVWNFEEDEDITSEGNASLSMVPESYQMSSSTLSDLRMAPGIVRKLIEITTGPQLTNGEATTTKPGDEANTSSDTPSTAEVACQTIATGDIIATQLYQQTNKMLF